MGFSFSDTLLHDLLYFPSCQKSYDVIKLVARFARCWCYCLGVIQFRLEHSAFHQDLGLDSLDLSFLTCGFRNIYMTTTVGVLLLIKNGKAKQSLEGEILFVSSTLERRHD